MPTTTSTQVARYIDVTLHKPHPDKEGYLQFDRNITAVELADEIQKKMTPSIAEHLEWHGLPYSLKKGSYDADPPNGHYTRNDPLPARDHSSRSPHLIVEWSPGNSEGYVCSVYALREKEAPLLVWTAEMFNIYAVMALHAELVMLLFWGGLWPQRAVEKIVAQLMEEAN